MPFARNRSEPILAIAVLAAIASSSCRHEPEPSNAHVFLFVGDGMSLSSEMAASRYRYGTDGGLAWHSFPFSAWVATWNVTSYNARATSMGLRPYNEASADPLVGYDPAKGGEAPWPAAEEPAGARSYLLAAATDSAAAATAISTGCKTDSGNIAWKRGDPLFGGRLETVVELLSSRYRAATGIVSTVPFNHATPASFVAHSTGRGDYSSIASQMIASDLATIIGGGHPDRCATYLSQDMLSSLRASRYWALAEPPTDGSAPAGEILGAEASALPQGMGLFGLFGGADGAFATPAPRDEPGFPALDRGTEDPSLAEAVAIAAELLAKEGGAFLLVAEQGEIDWANHANDYGRMVGAVCSLDDAVRAVEAFVDRPGDDVTWENSLLIVTADHTTGCLRFDPSPDIMAAGDLPESAGGGMYSFPGGTAYYAATGHANELVTLAAKGAMAETVFGPHVGSGRPGTRIMENTAIFSAVESFAGLE